MYDKILVAIDHSPASDHALAAARDLATLSKGEVWVLHLAEKEVIAQLGDVPIESNADAESPVGTSPSCAMTSFSARWSTQTSPLDSVARSLAAASA